MRFRTSLGPALLLGLGATFIAACSSQDAGSPAAATAAAVDGVPSSSGSTVSSRAADGTPTFVWAAPQRDARPIAGAVTDVARAHLAAHANVLGIAQRLATTVHVANEHHIPNGGSVVTFEQKIGDIPVFQNRAAVIMDAQNRLVAISGNLRAGVGAGSKASRFVISEKEAVAKAYQDRFGIALDASGISLLRTEENGQWSRYRVTTAANAPRIVGDVRVRKIYIRDHARMVGAFQTELISRMPHSKANEGFIAAIAADDGRAVLRGSLTAHEKFSYRVWAESGPASQNNIPTDGPLTDSTPLKATATPANTKETAFAAPIVVTVDGFNKNPAGAADPWLAATATESKGNNIDAYTDRNDKNDDAETNDGFDEGVDLRASTTAPLQFDRPYDVTKAPNATPEQMKAAVTQLFYVTNWMHDYWYDSGFNEKAGNAQASNYGRGGVENDVLNAQGQDAADNGALDNANMSTPSDGESPRMQMYVWSGARTITLTTSPAVTFAAVNEAAGFGKQTFDVTANAVLAAPADACTALTNAGALSGKIAVVDRGTCAFTEKAKAAEAAGAIGIIIANNAAGQGTAGLGGSDATVTNIAVAGITQEDGVALKAKMTAGAVSVHLTRVASVIRDGTIDNAVIAHEWGHYLHHRLENCFGHQCGGMSEGWADFNALMMVVKAGDDLENTAYPLSLYAGGGSGDYPAYFGIRRQPYSRDLAKFSMTYKHIADAEALPTTAPLNDVGVPHNEVHNVGEIWAETLFEGYTNMLKDTQGTTPRFDFTTAKRRMANYVVAGMQATPNEADFIEQRDALLAVAYAADPKDFDALAKGFAKRGFGVGAVAPPLDSKDFKEVKEDFSVVGKLTFVDATLDDAVRSCDRDSYLDADEKGDVTIRLQNGGWKDLVDTTATVTTTAPGVTFDNGGAAALVKINPYGIATLRVTAAYDGAATAAQFIPITVTLANKDAIVASVDGKIEPRGNTDDALKTVKTDDVESPKTTWTPVKAVTAAGPAWTRVLKTDADGNAVSPPNYRWLGANLNEPSDESLVSPTLEASTTESFKLSFTHKYSFEAGPSSAAQNAPIAYFDGAVLEVSDDDGTTWKDVTTYGVDPKYTHVVFKNSDNGGTPADDNALAARNAWAGAIDADTPVSLDFGNKLAGKKVKVRFRVASDANTNEKGLEIDDLVFEGITNTPFSKFIDDASVCAGVPEPDAGKPQTVAPGAKVVLDGSASKDPDGDAITFKWSQLTTFDTDAVELTTAEEAKSGFTAPMVTEKTTLTFRVTVADAKQAAAASVQITVDPGLAAGDGGTGPASNSGSTIGTPGETSCGCTTVGTNGTTGLGALGAALAGVIGLFARKRRRSN